jgi:hypothetical protein
MTTGKRMILEHHEGFVEMRCYAAVVEGRDPSATHHLRFARLPLAQDDNGWSAGTSFSYLRC